MVRRSANPQLLSSSQLSDYPGVTWSAQQRLLKRVKRDLLDPEPLSAPSGTHLTQDEVPSRRTRARRETRRVTDARLSFNDPYYGEMWHINADGLHTRGELSLDMGVQWAWRHGFNGEGVVVSILDDGIERTHPDLAQNYADEASYDVNGNDHDPTPRYSPDNVNKHGTRCAGQIAAVANNSNCVVGLAYKARIGGIRMLDGDINDWVESASLGYNVAHVDIMSASWGPEDNGTEVDGPGELARRAFLAGTKNGRRGRGVIYVWASGNGGRYSDSCSCDGYQTSIYTLSVSSISATLHKPWYLEECPSTLATTFSSGEDNARPEPKISTTDLHSQCTHEHTGTSASAPIAAALIALTLQANPMLDWRDVQYVTLIGASPNLMLNDGPWVTNALGRRVSSRYGYGMMNATAMIQLASIWQGNVPPQHTCHSFAAQFNEGFSTQFLAHIYSDGCVRNSSLHVRQLEHVVLISSLSHTFRGDIRIVLESPSGTRSEMLPARRLDTRAWIDPSLGFDNWPFMSVQFWGEDPTGVWKIYVNASKSPETESSRLPRRGFVRSFQLVFYGTDRRLKLVLPRGAVRARRDLQRELQYLSSELTHTLRLYADVEEPDAKPECHEECVGGCSGPHPWECATGERGGCRNFIIYGELNTCVSQCPESFFAMFFQPEESAGDHRGVCIPCHPYCRACVGPSEHNCTACIDPDYSERQRRERQLRELESSRDSTAYSYGSTAASSRPPPRTCDANLEMGDLLKQSQGSWVVTAAELMQLGRADSRRAKSNSNSNSSRTLWASLSRSASQTATFMLAPEHRLILLLSILALALVLVAFLILLVLLILRCCCCCAAKRLSADRRGKYAPLGAHVNGERAPSQSTSDETSVLVGPQDNLPERVLRPTPPTDRSSRPSPAVQRSPAHSANPSPPTQKFSSPGPSVSFHKNGFKQPPPPPTTSAASQRLGKLSNGHPGAPLAFPVNDKESESSDDDDEHVFFDSASLHRFAGAPLVNGEAPSNKQKTPNAASGFRMDMSRMEMGKGSANLISLSPAHETSIAGRPKAQARPTAVLFPFRVSHPSSNGASHDAFANATRGRSGGGKVVEMDALGKLAPQPLPLMRPGDART